MKLVLTLFVALLAANLMHVQHASAQNTGEHAGHDHSVEEPFSVERNRVVIQVNGVVCSFCAYGAQKSLANLDDLDSSEFGNGVFMDIHTHRMTLAMVPASRIPFREIYEKIKKAGYDPITVHVRLSGTLEGDDNALRLRDAESGQAFAVVGSSAGALRSGDRVEVQAHVDALTIPAMNEGELVGIWIDEQLTEFQLNQ